LFAILVRTEPFFATPEVRRGRWPDKGYNRIVFADHPRAQIAIKFGIERGLELPKHHVSEAFLAWFDRDIVKWPAKFDRCDRVACFMVSRVFKVSGHLDSFGVASGTVGIEDQVGMIIHIKMARWDSMLASRRSGFDGRMIATFRLPRRRR
jgi:hypothetical protein